MFLWIICLLPIGIIWIDRLATYIVVPISILIGIYYQKRYDISENKKHIYIFLIILFILSFILHFVQMWLPLIYNIYSVR